jgi:hypothetical protein
MPYGSLVTSYRSLHPTRTRRLPLRVSPAAASPPPTDFTHHTLGASSAFDLGRRSRVLRRLTAVSPQRCHPAATPDCEYPRCSSGVLLGCVSVTTSVTQHLIGLVPFVRLVRSWLPAPARSELLA